jgi:amidase
MRRFLERHEFLLCPVSQLPPYDVTVEWPRSIAGVAMDNYLDWMKSCYYVTITSHPAISVPAGFTDDDPPLPVGLQMVGRYRTTSASCASRTPSRKPCRRGSAGRR